MPINSFIYPGPSNSDPYQVANSCRFNDGDSACMHKTPSSSGNRRTFTFSTWVKKTNILSSNVYNDLYSAYSDSNNISRILYWDSNILTLSNKVGGSFPTFMNLNAKHRDPSAWLHICIAVDTTQGTESNRVKFYVNGTQETSFATETYPSQNEDFFFNHTVEHNVGQQGDDDSALYFDGYLAETVMIDGLQLAPTSFGEFDEDSPNIWKPKAIALTFGTNGFYLDFEDSSNLGNDASGGTDFTEVNLAATDQATDTPTNNFCTVSPLYNIEGSYALSEGNCIFTGTGGNDGTYGTMGVYSGKWYFEAEYDSNSDRGFAGWAGIDKVNENGGANPIAIFIGQYRDDKAVNMGVDGDAYTSITDGDILGYAINLDASSGSRTVVVQKNGSTIHTLTIATTHEDNGFIPTVGDTSSTDAIVKLNFGGCPSVAPSSAVADANGYGSFEYNPTIGGVDYLALCTKNLAEYG